MTTNSDTLAPTGRIDGAGVPRIPGLSAIADRYALILCDVWGVLHNGVKPREDTIEALTRCRDTGKPVILITNAPRQRKSVHVQLANLGVPEGVYDAVVTSGDVTRALIRRAPRKIFHIGTAKDRNLFEAIDVELVDEAAAEAVVCSGLFDEKSETPKDYVPLLKRLLARDLPLICANPDIVVEYDGRLEYCAGAIAREYDRLGGRTEIAGKPHAPIYEAAIAEAETIAGRAFEKSEILAIGDGLPTDVRGGAAFGLDVLYVSAGIHAGEYGPADDPDDARLQAFLAENGVRPAAYLPRLSW